MIRRTAHIAATWVVGVFVLLVGLLRMHLSATPLGLALGPGLIMIALGECLRYWCFRAPRKSP